MIPKSWIAITILAALLLLAGYGLKRSWQANAVLSQEVKAARQDLADQKKEQGTIAVIDTTYQEELLRANLENETLRDAIRAGTKRLYVKSACVQAATSPASEPDAESRSELDPVDADRIIAITQRGDSAIKQLGALQVYVTKVCLKL